MSDTTGESGSDYLIRTGYFEQCLADNLKAASKQIAERSDYLRRSGYFGQCLLDNLKATAALVPAPAAAAPSVAAAPSAAAL